jgi:hypothetical protein
VARTAFKLGICLLVHFHVVIERAGPHCKEAAVACTL